ncbi:glycosyltransferase family 4 protein [bacterium]|nr:glycosyltransferase family 4 protein [bacterium]
MKKILFLSNTANFSKFNIPYMRWFKEQGWQVDYCSPGEETVPDCDNQYSISIARSPFSLKNIKAYFELKKILRDNDYDILHCHTPMGGVIGRLAASDLRKKHKIKVIYTAHGFHFYKGAPLFNWLFYYPVERLLAHKTDVLITINKEDYERAKNFKAGEVVYVPGVGIDISKLETQLFDSKMKQNDSVVKTTQEQKLKNELGIPLDAPVLLSVGEINKNKNHKIIIEALPDMPDFWYVICGRGFLAEKYRKLAENLGVGNRLVIAGYRNDISAFYNMADIFVFPSLREGLPVALMEAMVYGLPIVCSGIRGNIDLIENGKTGEMVENSPSEFTAAILKLKNDPKLRDFYTKNAAEAVKHFDLASVELEMRKIYLREMTSG